MRPGSIAGPAAEAVKARAATRALPPESPLAMPRQPVGAKRHALRPGGTLRARTAAILARVLLGIATLSLSAWGAYEMREVMAPSGVTFLQWVFLGLFAVNFAWVGYAGAQAVLGFVRLLWLDIRPRRKPGTQPLTMRTAILAPVYNENPQAVAAALAAMTEGLDRLAPGQFAAFILSDSTRPDAWVAEEAVFMELIAQAPEGCPIYYRHRRHNTERKAGNIADWVTRWGGAYDAMLVLDADSLMAPETVIEMARRLQADPGLGLLQTLPAIVHGQSLYARLQQFANRCYGPIFGNGLAAWHGRSSNFWGHNAIIRTRAFAESAGLPELSGKPPFGGHVLSHDFIEAGLLRRAGWGVRLATDLDGSYEEAPPSLTDVIVRDRRWCQGNLQHTRFLFARGLALATRLHLLSGIMAYLSAVLWFLLVIVGLIIAVQASLTRPEYFTEPSLFPTWPVFDSERAIKLFAASMAVVLTPKLLGWLSVMLNPRRLIAFGGPVLVTLGVATELLLSVLYAPIMMVAQANIVRDVLTGRDSGWTPQRRSGGGMPLGTALRAHRWHIGTGVAMAVVAYLLNPHIFLWLLPVTAGLLLAAPLSMASASTGLGNALRRLGILRTPEERHRRRPAILDLQTDKQAQVGPVPMEAPLDLLMQRPALRQWHIAQLPDATDIAPFDEPLVVARAKAEQARDRDSLQHWLTREETMALLHDRALVDRLPAST